MPSTCGENGFKVTVTPTHDMSLIRRQHGIPEKSRVVTSALVDGYVVEGHVPASAIKKLLAERPKHQGHLAARHAGGLPGDDRRQGGAVQDPRDFGRAAKVFAVE